MENLFHVCVVKSMWKQQEKSIVKGMLVYVDVAIGILDHLFFYAV